MNMYSIITPPSGGPKNEVVYKYDHPEPLKMLKDPKMKKGFTGLRDTQQRIVAIFYVKNNSWICKALGETSKYLC